MTVTRVLALPDDALEVHGVDDAGNEIVATGWQSAMTNHYPPACYDSDGNLVDGATPQPMTADEQHDYWLALLTAAAPPEPTVLFGG